MKSKMYKTDVLRLIFVWSLLQYGKSSGEDDLRDRMSALEQEVKELKSEVITRNELIRLLSQGVTQLTYEGSGNPKITSENISNTGSPNSDENDNNKGKETITSSPIKIIEARREMVGDQVMFTVKYKYDADGLTIFWMDAYNGYQMLNHTTISLMDGTRETITVTSLPDLDESLNATESDEADNNTMSYDRVHPPTVAVTLLANSGQGLRLELANVEGDDVQTDISLPVLSVEPSEFVYEEGEDCSFTVTIPPEREEGQTMMFGPDPVHFQQYLLDLDTDELKMGFSSSDFFERVDNKSYPEYQEWKIKLKTSEMKYSGVFTMATYEISQSETDLVKNTWRYELVSLHPSTQDGPFPTGYLSFLNEPWASYETLDDGTKERQEVCAREGGREMCDLSWIAVGDDVSNVKVYRMESDGTKTPVSEIPGYTENVFKEYNGILVRAQVTIPLSSTDKESERFLCEAQNALGKTATSKTVAYYHYTSPEILEKESEIQILNPNEVSMTLDLKVVCKVKGYPRPNVTFSIYSWGTSYYGVSPDEISEEGNEITTAVKYLTYDKEDPYAYNGGLGRLSSASCTAEIGAPYNGHDYYDIPIPSELTDV